MGTFELYHTFYITTKERYKYGNNADLLKLILDGTVHKTATNKPYHGKGLHGINMALNRNHINNLNIITNNVHANIENSEFKIMPNSFIGTFVYWEVNKTNKNSHGINRN